MKNQNRIIIEIVACVVIAIISFFVGRSQSEKIEKYVKGETIHDMITGGEIPHTESIPSKPILPMKPDTVYQDTGSYHIKEIRFKIDTVAIIAEYIKKKTYKKTLFDNKDGKFDLGLVIQYNSLDSLDYSFTPIKERVMVKRTIEPFINASYNSFGYVGAGAGVFINNFGIGLQYITDLKKKGFEININYKY